MIRFAAAGLAISLLVLPAWADDVPDPAAQQEAAEDSMLGMLTMRPGAEMSEADRGYVKAMQAMEQALMESEMSGNATGDFARVMILHHQSAIAMIDVLLAQKDVDPEVRGMAENMRAAQAKEIAALQRWMETHAQ